MPNGKSLLAARGGNRVWSPGPVGRGAWFVLTGLLILGGHAARGAASEVSKEYQIKAAFLYNFTRFVEWPHDRFADAGSPIVIGVLGRNSFGDELGRIVQGRLVNGRSIVVISIVTTDDARAAHLVFVPAGEEPGFERVGAAWKHAAIVTVGESGRFDELGGMITFLVEADKVRFTIDIDVVGRAGLKVGAQLQKLAKAIRRQP